MPGDEIVPKASFNGTRAISLEGEGASQSLRLHHPRDLAAEVAPCTGFHEMAFRWRRRGFRGG